MSEIKKSLIKYNKNYFSRLIKSKKYNALSVRLTARILHIKQHKNTITIYFYIYNIYVLLYLYKLNNHQHK